MTKREYLDAVAKPMQEMANERMISCVADVLNDLRMQYLRGTINRAEFDQRTALLDEMLQDVCRVKDEEV